MNLHKTEQFLPNGDFNKFYSLLTPGFTTTGPALIVAVNSITLKGTEGEFFGINEDRVLLMGNAQTVNTQPCSIEEFLNEFELTVDDRELVSNMITKHLKSLEDDLNKQQ